MEKMFIAMLCALTLGQIGSTVAVAGNCNHCIDSVCADTVYIVRIESVYMLRQEPEFSATDALYHGNKKIYEIHTADGSSIDYQYHYSDEVVNYDCYSVNNNAFDGDSYIFFNRRNGLFYITIACFNGFYPDKQKVDFENQTLILENRTYQSGYKSVLLADSVLFVSPNKTIKSITGKIMILHSR